MIPTVPELGSMRIFLTQSFWKKLWEELNLSFGKGADDTVIAAQIYIVAIGLHNPGNKSIVFGSGEISCAYLDAAKWVVLSHILDDVFDTYLNHCKIRECVDEQLIALAFHLDEPTLLQTSKDILTLVLDEAIVANSSRIRTELIHVWDSLNSRKQALFCIGILKMVLAGFIQTASTWAAATGKTETDVKHYQGTLLTLFKRLCCIFVVEPVFYEQVAQLPLLIHISSASAAMEMFFVFNEDLVPQVLTEAWNFILGPLVYFFNSDAEIRQHEVTFHAKAPTSEQWVSSVRQSWTIIRNTCQRDAGLSKLWVHWCWEFKEAWEAVMNPSAAVFIAHNLDHMPELTTLYHTLYAEVCAVIERATSRAPHGFWTEE